MTANFGGGGGGGAGDWPIEHSGGDGARGAGMIFLIASMVDVSDDIIDVAEVSSNGENGLSQPSGCGGGGGGGAGGSILVRASSASLATNRISAIGGSRGPSGGGPCADGASGGSGRVRLEYCQTQSGTTTPSLILAQISCTTSPDTDGDGCIDKREQQTAVGTEMSGGRRNIRMETTTSTHPTTS